MLCEIYWIKVNALSEKKKNSGRIKIFPDAPTYSDSWLGLRDSSRVMGQCR